MGIEFKRRSSIIEPEIRIDDKPATMTKADMSLMPKVEVSQSDFEIVTRVKIAGLDKNAIKTAITGNMLNITIDMKTDHDEMKGVVHRTEHIEKDFKFNFEIPAGIDASGIKVSYENGVLIVRMPKHPGMSAKPIG